MRRVFPAVLLSCFFLLLEVEHVEAAGSRIIPRSEWGADDSLLFKGNEEPATDTNVVVAPDETTTVSERVKACEEAQKLYPQEFKVAKIVTEDSQGRAYRWPLWYSPSVKLIVVHHTAITVNGDARTPLDRIRALYTYHTQKLGWGDIGYHYLISEDGQIFEGKAGGDYVIGGHAYCANIGTVGVALLGNFEQEEPTQEQIRGLQWLLRDLSHRYRIDLSHSVTFHGKTMEPVVGHRDVVATACPGYFLYGVLNQVIRNVVVGNLGASVTFPKPLASTFRDRSAERKAQRLQYINFPAAQPLLTPIGSTEISGRPSGQVTASLTFRAGSSPLQRLTRIASVVRSSPRIGIWQTIDGRDQRVRKELLLPSTLHEGATTTIHLRFQLPEQADVYTVDIGEVTYTLSAGGRRVRTPTGDPVQQTYRPSENTN
ncbi:MAG: peptidoglycan recognition family protein, partial [Candidatus Peribacteraceae bacterium]|nr:peptidoglycan recognition family protein [Candidatus Peribacteraceae bacterium]